MTGSKFNEFVQIVERLRKECPWDKEQTNDSIKAATIEEAYEVVDAIDNKDYDELKKEIISIERANPIGNEKNQTKPNSCPKRKGSRDFLRY